MPIYEYKCEGCGKVFELRQKFADAPLTTHDECGAPVRRLISAPALQFKGTGWYITDYAKGNGSVPPKASGESKGDSKSEGKSESKSDSKSEAKPAAPSPSSSGSSEK